jgi:hypothetical protein
MNDHLLFFLYAVNCVVAMFSRFFLLQITGGKDEKVNSK